MQNMEGSAVFEWFFSLILILILFFGGYFDVVV